MGKSIGGIVALGALMVMGATEIAAQSIKSIMGARERLELTEEQLQDLEVLRREAVQARTEVSAELEELRSRLQAGELRRSEMMAFMEERRDQREVLLEQRRERFESILTEDQLEELQQVRQQRGRMGVRPGGRSGMDGPGFAPRGRAELRGPQGSRRGPPRASQRRSSPRGRFGL